MIRGRCKKCKQIKFLTKHSKIGNHQPPFIYICRSCHNKIHGITEKRNKLNRKYVRGTPHQHKKKHIK